MRASGAPWLTFGTDVRTPSRQLSPKSVILATQCPESSAEATLWQRRRQLALLPAIQPRSAALSTCSSTCEYEGVGWAALEWGERKDEKKAHVGRVEVAVGDSLAVHVRHAVGNVHQHGHRAIKAAPTVRVDEGAAVHQPRQRAAAAQLLRRVSEVL